MEISQKLLAGSFKWIKNTSQFNKDFIENYNEITDEGYFLKVDVQCSEKLHDLYNDLPFFAWKNENWKIWKLCGKVHDKKEYFIHMRNLKQALSDGLVLKKVHRVIKFYQEAWLKPWVDMNTELRKMKKMISKTISSWWILQFLEKLLEILENTDIKLTTTETRNSLVWFNIFCKNLLAIEIHGSHV